MMLSELKRMRVHPLLERLQEQIEMAYEMCNEDWLAHHGKPMPEEHQHPAVLIVIGDFEIRARFDDSKP